MRCRQAAGAPCADALTPRTAVSCPAHHASTPAPAPLETLPPTRMRLSLRIRAAARAPAPPGRHERSFCCLLSPSSSAPLPAHKYARSRKFAGAGGGLRTSLCPRLPRCTIKSVPRHLPPPALSKSRFFYLARELPELARKLDRAESGRVLCLLR
jgi:hypothetical protein